MFIFLYGEDTYRSSQKLQEIKQGFTKKTDPSGLNISVFEGERFNLEKFNSAANQSGFLVAKRLVIVKNLLISKPNKEIAEQMLELLKRLKTGENIFVFYEGGKPDMRTSLFKLLALDKKYTQVFEVLNPLQLSAWIKNYLAQANAKISSAAFTLLASYLNNNLWQTKNELDKLVACAGKGEITSSMIKELLNVKMEENIFGLTDAIASSNRALGLKLLNEQLELGLNEIYLLSMIIRQFRIIAQLKFALDDKLPEREMAVSLSLHPFVVKKTLPLAKKFTLEKIQNIYKMLLSLEKKFKSTTLSPEALIDLLVMKV